MSDKIVEAESSVGGNSYSVEDIVAIPGLI